MKNRIAFALLMGVITTGVISFAIIYMNLGLGGPFLTAWTRSWGLAYLIVIPVILWVAPRLQALIAKRFIAPERAIARSTRALQQRIAFALIMGAVTTGVISLAVILRNFGFREDSVNLWVRSWGAGYLVVIPALLIVAPGVQRLVDRIFRQTD
jgi:hypothetical protein